MIHYQQSVGVLRAHTLAGAFSSTPTGSRSPLQRHCICACGVAPHLLVSVHGEEEVFLLQPLPPPRQPPEYARAPPHRIARHRGTNEVHAAAPVVPASSPWIE
jgi:hypothetical protein